MMAYTNPREKTKDESERLRGEGNKVKFIDFRFERRQVVGFRERRGRRQDIQERTKKA